MFEMDRVLEIETERRRLDAERARLLADLDATGETDIVAGMRTGAWLAASAGLPHHAMKAAVRRSVELVSTFDVLLDELGAARIGWEHIEVISRATNPRIIDGMVQLQAEFVELAQDMVFVRWAEYVKATARRLDLEGGFDPDDGRTSTASIHSTLGGAILKGWFTDDLSVPMTHAINTKIDELFHRARRDRESCPDLPMPSHGELAALAIAELIATGAARTIGDTKPAAPECNIIVDPATGEATTTDGITLTRFATAILTHDAFWSLLRYSDNGAILDYHRDKRFAPPTLRRLLQLRDRGCVFPGCEHPATHCDAHHVIPWKPTRQERRILRERGELADHEEGGQTNIDNLAMLCRHHHRVTHRNNWHMYHVGDQRFEWITPTGTIIASQRGGQPRAPDTPMAA